MSLARALSWTAATRQARGAYERTRSSSPAFLSSASDVCRAERRKGRSPAGEGDFGKAGEAIVLLDDNDAARNFYAMLPLKLSFEDFNSTEKIATLPQKLSLGSSPTSCDPEKGSFTYYIPWGNIAVFYRDFRPSRNLVPLGSVVRGMDLFAGQKGDFLVRIERTE